MPLDLIITDNRIFKINKVSVDNVALCSCTRGHAQIQMEAVWTKSQRYAYSAKKLL
jgi:hypothetical protein